MAYSLVSASEGTQELLEQREEEDGESHEGEEEDGESDYGNFFHIMTNIFLNTMNTRKKNFMANVLLKTRILERIGKRSWRRWANQLLMRLCST